MKREKLATDEKLRLRCRALARLLPLLRSQWELSEHETQRDLIETLVGAALWYLPKVPGLWTGLISAEAVVASANRAYLKKRPSEEQLVPRKLAARQLFADPQIGNAEFETALCARYCALYGRFHYVTTSENKRLVQYQRGHVFERPSRCYASTGITLLPISTDELRRLRKCDADLAERVLGRPAISDGELDKLAGFADAGH